MISLVGISRLEVENSFINYFSKKTEIYKGMKLIDEKLGGTTPLEVILKFQKNKVNNNDDEDEFDDWENEDDQNDENIGLQKTKLIEFQKCITTLMVCLKLVKSYPFHQ